MGGHRPGTARVGTGSRLPGVGEYDPTVPVKIVTVGPAETSPSATIKEP